MLRGSTFVGKAGVRGRQHASRLYGEICGRWSVAWSLQSFQTNVLLPDTVTLSMIGIGGHSLCRAPATADSRIKRRNPMNSKTSFKFALAMCALASSAFSLNAAAWQVVAGGATNNTAPGDEARAVVSLYDHLFILSKTYVNGSGYRVATYNISTLGPWSYVGTAGGTSLTVSIQNKLWLIDANGNIWKSGTSTNFVPTSWVQQPNNACEGGSIAPRQISRDNNIAVGTPNGVETPYVIEWDGNVRMWNGSCYASQPLPSGRARDIGVWSDLHNPWAVNGENTIFRWNGSSWVTISSGLGTGVNLSYTFGNSTGTPLLIGQGESSFWKTTDNGASFTNDTSWFGQLVSIGTTVRDGTTLKQPTQVAITDSGVVMTNGIVF